MISPLCAITELSTQHVSLAGESSNGSEPAWADAEAGKGMEKDTNPGREHEERAGGYALSGKKESAGGRGRSNEKKPRKRLRILWRQLYLSLADGRLAGVSFHGESRV